MRTVVTTSNIMRVEFHTSLHPERSRRDLASRSISFEIAYASLPLNASSSRSLCSYAYLFICLFIYVFISFVC